MGGIDDLFDDIEDVLNAELAEDSEDDTERVSARLIEPRGRASHNTPVLSGKKMAGSNTAVGARPMPGETIEVPMRPERTVPNQAAAEKQAVVDAKPAAAEESRKKKKAIVPPTKMSFDMLFRRGGIPDTQDDSEFTVYRLERLMQDEDILALQPAARRAAIRAVLKSHSVEPREIVADAVRRQELLEQHGARLVAYVEKIERQLSDENETLSAEIEQFASPRLAKIESNHAKVDALREDCTAWQREKAAELYRIASAVEPWDEDGLARTTERVAAIPEEPRHELGATSEPVATAESPTSALLADSLREPSFVDEVFGESPSLAEGSYPEEPFVYDDDEPSVSIDDENAYADERMDVDVTIDFDAIRPRWRVPGTPLQGFAGALALILWVLGGLLLAAQLTRLQAPVALGVGYGAPLLVAIVVSTLTRGGRWSSGFFNVLLLSSIAALAVAHYDPDNLVESLTHEPLWFLDEAGLEDPGGAVGRLAKPYAQTLIQSGLASARAAQPGQGAEAKTPATVQPPTDTSSAHGATAAPQADAPPVEGTSETN